MSATVDDRCPCGANLRIDMPKNANLAAEQHKMWLERHVTCRNAWAASQEAEARRKLAEDIASLRAGPDDQARDSYG